SNQGTLGARGSLGGCRSQLAAATECHCQEGKAQQSHSLDSYRGSLPPPPNGSRLSCERLGSGRKAPQPWATCVNAGHLKAILPPAALASFKRLLGGVPVHSPVIGNTSYTADG